MQFVQVDKVRGETEFRARTKQLPPQIVEHVFSYAVATGTDLNSHEATELLDSLTAQWADGELDIDNIDKYRPVQMILDLDESESSCEDDSNGLARTPSIPRTHKPPCVKASERWDRNADGVPELLTVPGAQKASLDSEVEDKRSEGTEDSSDGFEGNSSDDGKGLREQAVTENHDQYKLNILKELSGRGEFSGAYVSLR